jgi:hypothetical protein
MVASMITVCAANQVFGDLDRNTTMDRKNCINYVLTFMIINCLLTVTGCQPTTESNRLAQGTETTTIRDVATTPSVTSELLSLLTMTPTPTEVAVSSTTVVATKTPVSITPTPAEPDKVVDMGRLVFARYEYYGWFDLVAIENSEGLVFDETNEYHRYTSPELIQGPGQSTYHVFSHYSDHVAFWKITSPGELWITDVSYQNPQLLLIDFDEVYVPSEGNLMSEDEYLKIIWSPDDLYLFFYSLQEPDLSQIYHRNMDKLEPWYWSCDTVILSSRSGKLATLCRQLKNVSVIVAKYAVLEWGGEIWFSDALPGDLFLEPLPDGTAFWQWSANGQWIAYFDPNDQEGHLFIADAEGNIRKLLPGISPFRVSEIEGYQQYQFLGNDSPFRWAREAPILLVNGFGQPEQPCPPLVSEEFGPRQTFAWHCWQAVNVSTGEIIWHEANLAENLSLNTESEELLSMGINHIVISPDGRAIAALTSYDMPRIVVVDLQTGQPTVVSRFDRFRQIYWGG